MKVENDWRFKTLDKLEKVIWGQPNYDSHLVRRCHELRTVPLNNFTIEDLRIMIGQNISLPYLMPLAIETLSQNLFAGGDLYEGDLLSSVLSVEPTFWDTNKQYWLTLNNLMTDHRHKISESKISTVKFDDCHITQ